MYRNVWNNCHNSVCQINFYSNSGIKSVSMTGFKANRHFLITGEYFLKSFKKASEIEFCFFENNGFSKNVSKRVSAKELDNRIIREVGKKITAFAVINIDFEEFNEIPSLNLSLNKNVEIGQPIAILGCQLEQSNLCIKSGIVSSTFINGNNLKYIQIDSSIKQGNSGSPIVNTETMEVIGIIGHKLAGITQSHIRMRQIINKNLAILKKSQGLFNVEDIDPIQVLIANQNQIKYITNDIYKTATMSIGYGLDISYVHELFNEFIDIEVLKTQSELHINV